VNVLLAVGVGVQRLEVEGEQHLLNIYLTYIVERAASGSSAARPMPALGLVDFVLVLIVEHVAHLMEQIGGVD